MEAKHRWKSVIISTHIYSSGPAQSLAEYLRPRIEKLIFIGHPFIFAKQKKSYLELYKNHKLSKSFFFPYYSKFLIINLIKDILLTFAWAFRYEKSDTFIGVDNINASIGILLKKMGRTKKVIFYTIDYVPNRFPNKFLNKFYHMLDKFAVVNSDYVWNLADVMIKERELSGIKKKYRAKQLLVPMGTDSHIKSSSFKSIKRFHAVHMGHLIRKQGVQMVIKAIPEIIKKIPKFHLDIIGGGEYEQELKTFVARLGINNYVTFYGYIQDHDEVEKMMSKCAIGLAPYVDSKDNYIRYSDPGKVKAYLAAGIPIVITKVPEISKYLQEKKCGIRADYSVKSISTGIIDLMKDDEILREYRKNARNVAKEFVWDKIFNNALAESI